MRITDDGSGIAYDDVPRAFLRHATSKVRSGEDLDHIATLGFRGEALASVCAVSRVELLTKTREDDFGTRYCIDGSEETAYEQAGCPDGTSITVRDLFYNVPARLKFLKKDVTEGNAVAGVIDKIALSHPQIAFQFIRDGRSEFRTAGDGRLLSAIYAVMGREVASSLIEVRYTVGDIQVDGYVSKPIFCRSNRNLQVFFVNGRFVRTKTAMVALEEAYRGSVMTGKFPVCVLRIALRTDAVDVNVHPAKIEIRFSDEKEVYNAVFLAVKDALYQRDTVKQIENLQAAPARRLIPVAPPSELTKGEQLPLPQTHLERQIQAQQASPRPPAAHKPETVDLSMNVQKGVPGEKAMETAKTPFLSDMPKAEPSSGASEQPQPKPATTPDTSAMYLSSDGDSLTDEQQPAQAYANVKIIGEAFKTYIIAQINDDLVFIDKHAAHERIIFEQLKQRGEEGDRQILLSPFTLVLAYDEYDALLRSQDTLSRLGFLIEDYGNSTVIVREVPMLLDRFNASEVITEIACNLKNHKNNVTPDVIDEMYHTVACKAAIKANDTTDLVELTELVKRIYASQDIRYCPHGRPVTVTITRQALEKQFKRTL